MVKHTSTSAKRNSASGNYRNQSGFTFIELVIVILILGVFVTAATQTMESSIDASRQAQVEEELNRLAVATVGNEQLSSGGMRTDFGYVGDIGALPISLDYLTSNPGGFSTWNGPYIRDNFVENSSDFKTDPWGANYVYSAGVTIQSTGSGGNITKQFANSTADILSTPLKGILLDRDGSPPGTNSANVNITVTYPNGAGGTTSTTVNPTPSGSFSFTGIPIGNHQVTAVYTTANDTTTTFVSTVPRVGGFAGALRLGNGYWKDTTTGGGGSVGTIEYVSLSGKRKAGGKVIHFKIRNTGATDVSISWMVVTWNVPSGVHAQQVWIATTKYFQSTCNRLSSGDTVPFSPAYVLSSAVVPDTKFQIKQYRGNLCGPGSGIVPSGTNFTVTFSNGDVINFIPTP